MHCDAFIRNLYGRIVLCPYCSPKLYAPGCFHFHKRNYRKKESHNRKNPKNLIHEKLLIQSSLATITCDIGTRTIPFFKRPLINSQLNVISTSPPRRIHSARRNLVYRRRNRFLAPLEMTEGSFLA